MTMKTQLTYVQNLLNSNATQCFKKFFRKQVLKFGKIKKIKEFY